MLNSCLQVCKNQGCKCSTEAPLMMNATAHGRRFMIRNPARNNFAPPNPKKTVAIRYEAAPRVRYMNPAMIAPVGPIKFCAGLFGGLTELNQTQEGTSLGVYEISARNRTVPAPSKTSPITSFHALCFCDCAMSAPSLIPRFWAFNPERRYFRTGSRRQEGKNSRSQEVGTMDEVAPPSEPSRPFKNPKNRAN